LEKYFAHLGLEFRGPGLKDFGLVEEMFSPGFVIPPVTPKPEKFLLKSQLFG